MWLAIKSNYYLSKEMFLDVYFINNIVELINCKCFICVEKNFAFRYFFGNGNDIYVSLTLTIFVLRAKYHI